MAVVLLVDIGLDGVTTVELCVVGWTVASLVVVGLCGVILLALLGLLIGLTMVTCLLDIL